jgi:phage terminase large subunit-like protein
LVWPNGAGALTFSGDAPDQLRGPAFDSAWADEPSKWRYAQDAWDNMEMGLRMGPDPRVVASTTPKPTPLMRALLRESEEPDSMVVVTRGTTYENAANLPEWYIQRILRRYEGTRLGRQELYAQLIDEQVGALWKRAQLEECRVTETPPFARVVVGVDPSISDGEESAETGIMVCAMGIDGRGYVLDDKSLRGSPTEWAQAVSAAYRLHRADRVIAETNQGGAMVELTLRVADPHISYRGVHASRNKQARAEPVSALYEQGKIRHLGFFADLEDQMTSWAPGEPSPDRIDAMVWAFTDLFGLDGPPPNPLAGMVISTSARGWQPKSGAGARR